MLLFSCKVRYVRWLKYLQVSQCGGFVGLRLALGLCLTCLLLFGPENFLIPAMLLITFILTLLRGKPGRNAV